MDPELQAIIMQALQSQGLPPEMAAAYLQQMVAQGPANPFTMGAGGDVQDANRQVDYMRDYNSLIADPYTIANAGLAGFGGPDLGIRQFTPKREYVEGPQNYRWQRAAQADPTTVDGWVAMKLREGLNPAEIAGEAQAFLNPEGELDPDQQALATRLAQVIGSERMDQGGNAYYDTSSIADRAAELETEMLATPSDPNAQYDPEVGGWYIEQPSEAMEMFDERGIPYPTMQYELGDFTPEGGEYEQIANMLQAANASRLQREGPALQRGYDDAYQRMIDTLNSPAPANQYLDESGMVTGGPEGGGGMPRLTPGPQDEGLLDRIRNYSWEDFKDEGWFEQGEGSPVRRAESSAMGWLNDLGQDMIDSFNPNKNALLQGSGGAGGFDWRRIVNPTYVDPATVEGLAGKRGQQGQQGRLARAAANPQAPNDFSSRLDQLGRAGREQHQIDNRDRLATDAFLKASRDKYQQGPMRDARDIWQSKLRSQGRRFFDPATGKFEEDRGIAQGRLNYATAMAQGRTPTSDALRERAMAAYMLGR